MKEIPLGKIISIQIHKRRKFFVRREMYVIWYVPDWFNNEFQIESDTDIFAFTCEFK